MDQIELVEKKNGKKLIKATVVMAENVFQRYMQHFSHKPNEASDTGLPVKEKKVRKRDQMPEDWLKSN